MAIAPVDVKVGDLFVKRMKMKTKTCYYEIMLFCCCFLKLQLRIKVSITTHQIFVNNGEEKNYGYISQNLEPPFEQEMRPVYLISII